MSRLAVVLLGLVCAGATAGADAARTTFPGVNGKIAFVRGASGARDIYTIGANGGGSRRVTRDQADEESPAFSPDGRRLAFVRECCGRSPRSFRIVVLPAAGGTAQIISRRRRLDTDPDWSPDGRQLVFVAGFTQLWLMNADGSNRRPLRTRSGEIVEGTAPAWSPDGRSIAFSGAYPGDPGRRLGIWLVRTDGTDARFLVPAGRAPDWAPDGLRILFVDRGRLTLIGVDGGGRRRLTSRSVGALRARWSPDGRRIVYDTRLAPGAPRELAVVSPDGGPRRRVTSNSVADLQPAWGARYPGTITRGGSR